MMPLPPCDLHGIADCARCLSPDEFLRWRIRHNDPSLSIGWGSFIQDGKVVKQANATRKDSL